MADNLTKGSYHRAYWDDLRAAAVAINPPGAASDPNRDPNTGWLLFDATATELVYITYQMPHGWVEASDVRFHCHWHKSSASPMSGTVAWRMRYRRSNIGSVWSAWSAAEGRIHSELRQLHARNRRGALDHGRALSLHQGR